MKADLHVHTSASDGLLAPAEVARHMRELGVGLLSVTDHDTVGGLAEAEEACRSLGIRFVAGIEISAHSVSEIHVLGYNIDYKNSVFCEEIAKVKDMRRARNIEVGRKLAALGVELDIDFAADGLGRMNIARIMVEKGFAKDIQDAFNRFLGPNGKAYSDTRRTSPLEAVKLISAFGGLPVLAHPKKYLQQKTLRLLVEGLKSSLSLLIWAYMLALIFGSAVIFFFSEANHAFKGFDTGERILADTSHLPPLYQDVFGETLVELAKVNPRIVGVTPAMPTGCSMNKLMEAMPDRAFDVGIAEGHAATFSGGMAKEGLQPFCNIYSSFMQRAYDNVIHDIALLRLPVVLCLDRAGLVGEDGPTHHGVFDLAYFRPIPNLTIASPMNEHELRRLMYTAQLPDKGPFVIRYPRGRGVLLDWRCPLEEVPVGKGRKLKDGTDVAVLTLGPIGNVAARAIERAGKDARLSVAHYDLRFLKPLDEELLHEVGRNFRRIVTVEDGVIQGGMGSAVLEFMADNGYTPRVERIGVPDRFIEQGSIPELYKLCGMDAENIYRCIMKEV